METLRNEIEEKHAGEIEQSESALSLSFTLINSGALGAIETNLDALLTFFIVRAHSVFTSGVLLCRYGYAPESVMQARALMESLINLRYMIDNEDAVHRYAEWDDVIKKRALDRVRDLDSDFQALKDKWEAKADEIIAGFEEFRAKYRDDFHAYRWAGRNKSLWQLAQDTQSKELYSFYYSFGSEIVHGSTVTSEYYIDLPTEEDDPVFRIGGRDLLVPDALRMLITLLLLHWDEVAKLREKPTREVLLAVPAPGLFAFFARD